MLSHCDRIRPPTPRTQHSLDRHVLSQQHWLGVHHLQCLTIGSPRMKLVVSRAKFGNWEHTMGGNNLLFLSPASCLASSPPPPARRPALLHLGLAGRKDTRTFVCRNTSACNLHPAQHNSSFAANPRSKHSPPAAARVDTLDCLTEVLMAFKCCFGLARCCRAAG